MPPPIFTDAYIRKVCPENHPIPLAKIPTMGATKPPQYLAKGYTGIKYVPPPHRPPRTVHTLATMMAGTSEPEAVRTQEEVINRFVAENAFQTMGDILGVRRGVEYFVNEELFAGKFLRDEGEEETKAEVEVNAEGVEETKDEAPAQEEKGETEDERQQKISDNINMLRDRKRDAEEGYATIQTAKGKARGKKNPRTETNPSPAKTRSQASELITPASPGKSPMRRGRKPGSKNRSKVEIEEEKRQRQKNIQEGQRAEEAYRKQNLRGAAQE